MSAEIENKTFELLADQDLPVTLSGASLKKCRFKACHFGETARAPHERRMVHDVSLVNCSVTNNSGLGPVIIKDVNVRGLQTSGVCFVLGAVYQHVTFSGQCGKFVLAGADQSAFQEANREFYSGVDWALDISNAEFAEFELYGTPSHLVRRDPSTQVVVHREVVVSLAEKIATKDFHGSPWPGVLSRFLESDREDQILVAPKKHKDFARWRQALDLLCEMGVAER